MAIFSPKMLADLGWPLILPVNFWGLFPVLVSTPQLIYSILHVYTWSWCAFPLSHFSCSPKLVLWFLLIDLNILSGTLMIKNLNSQHQQPLSHSLSLSNHRFSFSSFFSDSSNIYSFTLLSHLSLSIIFSSFSFEHFYSSSIWVSFWLVLS